MNWPLSPSTEVEVKRMFWRLKYLNFWLPAVLIGRYTGLRIGDVVRLEWESLSTPGKFIVWTRKRDKRIALDGG